MTWNSHIGCGVPQKMSWATSHGRVKNLLTSFGIHHKLESWDEVSVRSYFGLQVCNISWMCFPGKNKVFLVISDIDRYLSPCTTQYTAVTHPLNPKLLQTKWYPRKEPLLNHFVWGHLAVLQDVARFFQGLKAHKIEYLWLSTSTHSTLINENMGAMVFHGQKCFSI